VVACLDAPPSDDGETKAGGSTAPHRIYNLGNSRSEPLMRLIALLEAACGKPAKLDMQPIQPGDVPETFADISVTQADLMFAPTTTIDVGVPRFVSWYRDYKGVT
jgi:UDP-glucuronate 4-epimerase